MTDPYLPHVLEPVAGPFATDKVEGSVKSLGRWGAATADLVASGWVPPDLLVGCTLRLLASQPRTAPPAGDTPAAASPIAGGVWVREQVSFHRPVGRDEEVVITGETVRRYVRKGRSYSTSVSRTEDRSGRLLVSNVTTGLTHYRADAGRGDSEEGSERDPIMPRRDEPAPGFEADHEIVADPVEVSLEMMQVRDGARSDNPIHSDPEVARQAGLVAPIAGGSHVLAFAIELVLAEWGPDALLGGSHLDVRWLGQTRAGDTVQPTVEVVDRSTLRLSVEGPDRTCLVADLGTPG